MGQYDRITNGKTCNDNAFGVFGDGSEKAKQIKACTNGKMRGHGFAAGQVRGSRAGQGEASGGCKR